MIANWSISSAVALRREIETAERRNRGDDQSNRSTTSAGRMRESRPQKKRGTDGRGLGGFGRAPEASELVPEYNTLTVTVRGGGGQGFGLGAGYNGGNSSFNGDVIGEGGHAPADASAGGAGGIGIGGDQNHAGGTGGGAQALVGGRGANGAGGAGNSVAGQAPGGGGSGGNIMGAGMPGGGGGGCAMKTYRGELSPGAIITVVVGDGGNLAVGAGERGARGQVDVSWD